MAGFTSTTLTHTFTNPDGTPATGTLTFTLTKAMTNGSSTILPAKVVATLDGTGSISQSLVSNADTGTNPPDAQWRVDLRLNGMDPLSYFIVVPASGGSVDLGTLLPSEGTTVPVDYTTQWQTYLDFDLDVKPYLEFTSSNVKYDPQLQNITEMACTWVQNYINKAVAPTTFTRFFDGNQGYQGSYLMLPYYPVLQVVSVVEWWGNSGPHTLNEQTPSNQGDGEMYNINRQTGVITRVFSGMIEKPWFPGARNVQITWVAGYNPVPKDIREATLELINYFYRNTQEAARMVGPNADQYDQWQQAPGSIPQHVYTLLQKYKPLLIG